MTVTELFLAQTRRTPDAPAVRQWAETLTYRDLAGRASLLAERLRAAGAGRESRVGVCVDRRPGLIVALLGILMSGAAYVPLDPSHPPHRRGEILKDAGVVAVVVDDPGQSPSADEYQLVVVPETGTEEWAAGPAGPDDVAQVLYTSGSTGQPKGVLVTHGGVAAFATTFAAYTGVGADSRVLASSSPAFDALTMDVFVPLLAGACVQLAAEADRMDPARLERFLAEHEVTWAALPPAMLRLLDPGRVPGVRALIIGSELVEPELVERWTAGVDRRFWHSYGPTEATVIVSTVDLAGRWTEPLPLGPPLPGNRFHIVDPDLAPVTPGEAGELLIGGPGLARGYLGRPGQTAARFVPDPFSGEPGARLYRTGDMVRELPGGRLRFLGRRDRQVKVRGQRVELAEVEAALRSHDAVSEAAVEAVPGPSGLELVAFVAGPNMVADDPAETAEDDRDSRLPGTAARNRTAVSEAGLRPGADSHRAGTLGHDQAVAVIRDFCAARLTPAMVPSRVLVLDRLPASQISGKLDRAKLRDLAARATADHDEIAAVHTGQTHRAVAAIWVRVLGGSVPAGDRNFFAEGAHSISVMRMVAAIRAELGRDVGAKDVFDGGTLDGIVARVEQAAVLPDVPVLTGNPPTLSRPQQRLWFLEQLAPDSAAYNVAFAERLLGPLDVEALRAALRTVSERHDVLRWRVVADRGAPTAVCDPVVDVPMPVVLATATDLPALLVEDVSTPFNLEIGPVWRVKLYRLGPDHHVLHMVLHHAVSDGWSRSILYREIAAAYSGTELPPLTARFADYAVWRAARYQRDGAADLAWWMDHLAGAPTVVDLPRDRPRPPVQTYDGQTVTKRFPAELDAAVRAFTGTHGVTPSHVVLTALNEVLRRLTGRGENIIGVVAADRGERAFADLIGFCIDVLPLRLRSGAETGFDAAVAACRTEFLAAAAHSAAPHEQIVFGLKLPRDPAIPPLVQVLFNAFNFAEATLPMPGIRTEPVPVADPGSTLDLTVYLFEQDGRFALELAFNSDLFDFTRVDALLTDLLRLLGELLAEPARPIAEIGADHPRPALRQSAPAAIQRPRAGRTEPAAGAELGSPTENAIGAVWREVLGLTSVTATDNFFDVGGHSLTLVRVHARLAEVLDRDIRVVDLFKYPNIRALAGHLDGGAENSPLAWAAQRAAARRGRARRWAAVRTAEQEIEK